MPKYGITIANVKQITKGNKIVYTSSLIDPTAAPFSLDDSEVDRLIEVAESKVENRFSKFYITPFIGYNPTNNTDYAYALLPISTRRLIEELILWQTIIDLFMYYNMMGGGITQEILDSARRYYQTAENDVFNYKAGGTQQSTPLDGLKMNANLYQYKQGTPNIIGVRKDDVDSVKGMFGRGIQDMTQNMYWRWRR